MHGLIHAELAGYVKHCRGEAAWRKVLAKAQLGDRLYLQVGSYPDEEIVALVAAAAGVLRTSVDELLENFGFFLVPRLIEQYAGYVDPQWRTMEFLLNTESTIHRVVRLKDKFAAPPRLKFHQTGENSLALDYDSPRKMQAVARGMIKGVADWYNEKVQITEAGSERGGCRLEILILR